MRIAQFVQQSEEWLEERNKCITATEVSVLLGFNKYKSIYQLFEEKQNNNRVSLPDNIYMRAGRLLEPSVFNAVGELLGESDAMADKGMVAMLIDDDTRLACSLDGYVKHRGDSHRVLLEAKSTGDTKFQTWSKYPPYDYILQCHTQLGLNNKLTGMHRLEEKFAYLACLSTKFPFNLSLWKVSFNEVLHEIVEDSVKEFWRGSLDTPDKKPVVKMMLDTVATKVLSTREENNKIVVDSVN